MPKRLLALLALAALLLGAGCSDDTSPALRVGDVTYTHDELMDEIDEWAGNASLVTNFQAQGMTVEGPTGDPTTALTSFVIRFLIEQEVVLAEVEEQGLEPTAAAEEEAEALLTTPDQQGASIKDGFSADYYDQVFDYVSKQLTLLNTLGETPEEQNAAYTALVEERITAAEIEVSSKFGRWDPDTQQIIPPRGPSTSTTDPAAVPPPAG